MECLVVSVNVSGFESEFLWQEPLHAWGPKASHCAPTEMCIAFCASVCDMCEISISWWNEEGGVRGGGGGGGQP